MKKQQAKLKKHIYSSGAQGNDTSGPAQPDKRNKGELPCEFCQRVFKQQDRLKQHMLKHHAKQMHEREQQSKSQPPTPASESPQAHGSSEEKRKAALESGNKAGKVNIAKAPTHKAPRTILQEWLQKNRQAKPEFRLNEQSDGFICKVLLPHKYKPDSGRELWMNHAAPSKEEAMQRGAVVALATFATELPLDRLLAPEYKDIYASTVEKRKQEKEREQQQSEKHKKNRNKSSTNDDLQAIHMSEEKRRLVESVVQSLNTSKRHGDTMSSTGELSNKQASLAASLRSQGFYESDIMLCLRSCDTNNLTRALDWLCIHVDEKRLPRKYAPTTKDNAIEILNTGNKSSRTLLAENEDTAEEIEEPVADLMRLGFQQGESRTALDASSWDVFSAWTRLFHEVLLEMLGDAFDKWPYGDREANTEAWEDEKHSLQAIIGEDCVRFPSKNSVIVSQELPFEAPECDNNETSIDSATHGLKIELHAQILDGLGYPKAPPLLGVECSAMARPQLRSLTSWLCEQAAEHAHHGLPCISELAGMLPEMAAMVSRSLDSSVSGDDEGKEAQHRREHYHAQQPRGDEKWKEQESMNARKGNWASWRRGNRQQQYLRQRWSRQQDPSFIEQENVNLKQDLQRYLAAQSGKMAEMRNLRAGLPAYGHAAEVMQAVQNSRVVVLSGETGCGKSTQVPQQILDATIMANAGGRTKIVCTQPRRISAIGLADRVADERCESVGDTVGYRVRLDNKKSDRTRLLFCTTGILLRQLIEDPHLSDLSHIVVDEVHERSVEGDLLLLLLRKALGRRPDLRVILMSATADSELFLNYFKDVPPQEGFPNLTSRVHIPGLTHAVHDYFLEDVIELTGFSVGKGSKWARKKQSESRPDLGKSSKNASSKSLNAAVREEEEEEEEEDDDDQRLNEDAEGDGSNEVEHSQDEGNQTTAAATPGKVPQDGDEWEVAKGFKKEEDVQEQEPEFESWEDGFDEWDVEQVSGTAEQETNGNEKAVPDSWDADTNDGRASCVRTNEDNLVDLWDDDDGAIDEAINAAAVHAAQTNEEQHQEQEEHLGSQDNIEDVACGSVYRVLETDSGSEDNTTSATPPNSDTKGTSAIDSQQYVQTDEKTQLLQQQALGMDAIARVSRGEYREQTKRTLFNIDEEVLNYELIEAALAFICHTELETGERELIGSEGQSADECASHPGAILIFMPGMAEIMKTLRKLEQSPKLNEASVGRLWLLPLHGSLAAREQKMVFEKPPHGVRKVVLATNVAETALTVDDVRYVIDTGRLKEMTFDGHKGLAILEDAWVSKASATQRRGRAGRTAPGACLKLFSQNKHAQLEKQQTPEIQRTPLESLCLRVKAILGGNPHESLIEAISPPDKGAVDGAVSTLHALGALDQNEELTPLGQHLVRMPVDPKVGKMLIYAALLQCVDPVLTVASCIGGRGIFMAPQGKKDQADACKRAIGQSEGRSDHLAAVAAFNGWLRARERGKDAERAYCDNNFLSQTALEGVLTQRADFAATLAELGFLTPDYWRSVKRGIPPSCEAGTPDSNSRSKRIVKAALCAGFYPNVARIEHPRTKYVTTAGGAKEKKNEGHQVRFFTRDLGRVFIHPTSVNFGVGKFESPWMVYTERVKTSKVYLRESTMVPSYALLLFGGAITVHHERGTLKVDDWAEFEASPRTAVLVRELRRAVDGLLLDKIEDPALDVQSSGAVNALLQLLATDGV